MPLLETKAAASAQGFGLTLGGAERIFIEDVMSVFLYTGNGSTQTITNGIDLSTKGGLVWIKERNNTFGHVLVDTSRGINQVLRSNEAFAQTTFGSTVSAFNSNGFSLGSSSQVNESFAGYELYVSWTFRKQPKFFDVVTYTGNGASNRQIAHGLGSTPGCVIVKCTSTSASWAVWHRSIGSNQYMYLDSTIAATTASSIFGGSPTATTFTVAGGGANVATNQNGATYVAYLFAHDAGGFGLTGTDNVISCGSFTTDGSGNATVTLGYEPQWLLIKNQNDTDQWRMFDSMRGFSMGDDARLDANNSSAEFAGDNVVNPSPTGFLATNVDGNWISSATYIYIAIRRGPMRVPTSGTSVFNTNFASGGPPAFVTGFPVDLGVSKNKTNSTIGFRWASRITSQGAGAYLTSSDSSAETTSAPYGVFDSNSSWYGTFAVTSSDFFSYSFRRAPGFFDVVCYTGDGATNRLLNHNLTVQPELIITKARSTSSYDWIVTYLPYPNSLRLNLTNAVGTYANGGAPTATQFYVSGASQNNNTDTYVAYLFATVAGVSKVGSYTGNGSSLTINCGFTGGARFVLIKRTDSTGNWLVWDSARGIVAGNDPYLALNNTNSEVTTDDSLDTASSGFVVNQDAATNINLNGGTYIYLAIA